jgi:hypothetical protein
MHASELPTYPNNTRIYIYMRVCMHTRYTVYPLCSHWAVSGFDLFFLAPKFPAIDPNLAGSPQERTHWSEGKRLQFTLFGPAIKYTFFAEHISGLKNASQLCD